jgi:hypothetical protein
MKSVFRATAVALSFVLTACGTIPNGTGPERLPVDFQPSAGNGVIVFSTGAPDRCVSKATFLQVRHATTKVVLKTAPLVGVDVYTHKSDFADHHGTLNVLEMQPGTYLFTPWLANPYFEATKTPTFEFEVRAGEVAYLGEVFMSRSCSSQTQFVLRDNYDRDMKVVSQKTASSALRAPVKKLLRPGADLEKL